MENELSIELREQINKLVKDLIEEEVSRFHLHTAAYATCADFEKLLKVPGSNDEERLNNLEAYLRGEPAL